MSRFETAPKHHGKRAASISHTDGVLRADSPKVDALDVRPSSSLLLHGNWDSSRSSLDQNLCWILLLLVFLTGAFSYSLAHSERARRHKRLKEGRQARIEDFASALRARLRSADRDLRAFAQTNELPNRDSDGAALPPIVLGAVRVSPTEHCLHSSGTPPILATGVRLHFDRRAHPRHAQVACVRGHELGIRLIALTRTADDSVEPVPDTLALLLDADLLVEGLLEDFELPPDILVTREDGRALYPGVTHTDTIEGRIEHAFEALPKDLWHIRYRPVAPVRELPFDYEPFAHCLLILLATCLVLALIRARWHRRFDRQLAANAAIERDYLVASIENSTDGFVIFDTAGKVLYANSPMRRMLTPLPLEHVAEASHFIPARVLAKIRRALRRGENARERFERIDPPGQHFEAVASPLTTLATSAFTVSLRDVTREIAYERALQHRRETRALGHLTADLAHGLNNHLTVLLGQIDLGRWHADDGLHARLDEVTRTALAASEALRPLLAFCHATPFGAASVELGDAVRESCEHFTRLRRPSRAIRVVDQSDGAACVTGDRALFQMALEQLLANAHEACCEKGEIEVTIATEPGHSQMWQLSVRDDGVGMSLSARQRAFETCFSTKQRDVSSRSSASPADDPAQARGLGLTIAMTVVHHLGGSIDFDDSVSVGTRVVVLLPKAEPSDGPDPQAALEIPRPRLPIRVLIADDKAEIRSIAERVLAQAGHTVWTAADGRAALEVWQAHRDEIDVLLLDCRMPGMHGDEVLRKIRESSDVPAVLSSGFSTDALQRPALATALLPKPWQPAKLVEVLERCVHAARARDDSRDGRTAPRLTLQEAEGGTSRDQR